MKNFTLTLAILTASAGSAALAEGPETALTYSLGAAPTKAYSSSSSFWAGGYAGGQLGYGYGDFDLDDAFDGDDDGDGFVGGITLGYLWSLNNGWYLGPEFQYEWTDLEVTDSDTGDSISFDEMGRLKLIMGRESASGLSMIFGSIGVAYGSIDDVGDIFDGFSGSDTNWVAGLGYDQRINENWTLGAEYMYHDFDDINVNTLHVRGAFRF